MEQVKKGEVEQRFIGQEDFVAADDDAERRVIELAKRLSDKEAEAKRQRDELEAPRHRRGP
jgi:hypothetical protein